MASKLGMRSAQDVKGLLESYTTYPFSTEDPELYANGAVLQLLEANKKNYRQTAAALATELNIHHFDTTQLFQKIRSLNQQFIKFKKNIDRYWAEIITFLSSPFHFPISAYSSNEDKTPFSPPAAPFSPPAATSSPLRQTLSTSITLRDDCAKCSSNRSTVADSFSNLRSTIKKQKSSIADLKRKYSVRTVNQRNKRQADKKVQLQQQLADEAKLSSKLHKQVMRLQKDKRHLRRKLDKLCAELDLLKATSDQQKSEIKNLKQDLQYSHNELIKLKTEEDAEAQRKKSYSMPLRLAVYCCLSSNVPVEVIGRVIRCVMTWVANKTLVKVPCASTCANMMRELGLLSSIQVAEELAGTCNVTLAWDATTIDGEHLNHVLINFPTKTLSVSTQVLPGGLASDYATHIKSTLEYLAGVYCELHSTCKGTTMSLFKSKVLSTLTDRAAANHATVVLLQDYLNVDLLELNCQLHPLDGLANAARAALKKMDKELGLEVMSRGSDCSAANVLHLVSKLRYKAKGDPKGFKTFLKSKGRTSGLFVRYVGNRLHVLFHLAGTVFCHKDLILDYLDTFCSATTIATALRSDLQSKVLITQLRVLGIFGKLVTGPWMALVYTGEDERNHFAATEHLKFGMERLQGICNDPEIVFTIKEDIFGKPLVEDEVLVSLREAGVSKLANDIIVRIASSSIDLLNRQLARYIHGPLSNLTPELRVKASAAPSHNIWAERSLGMADSQMRKAPNAAPAFIDSKVKANMNNTLEWLEKKDVKELERLVLFVIKRAGEERKSEKERMQVLVDEVTRRLKVKMMEKRRRKDMAERRRLEHQVNAAVGKGIPLSSALDINLKPDVATVINVIASDPRSCIGKKLVHIWNLEGKEVAYSGKVLRVARKSIDFFVSYWIQGEDEEEDATDSKVKFSAFIVDIILGDLQFLDY